MEVINDHDFAPNVRIRLIALTILVIVVAILPAMWKLVSEFNRLVTYRQRWLQSKCDFLDLAWLSSQKVPGFEGWGEAKLKDFLSKNGLSSSQRSRSRATAQQRSPIEGLVAKSYSDDVTALQVDVMELYTIGDHSRLTELIEERDAILNQLEVAETRYIASFRMMTPDPSVADAENGIKNNPDELRQTKPRISRPKAFSGSSIRKTSKPRKSNADPEHSTPTSFVAPSSYYRLGRMQGLSGGSMSPRNHAFGKTIHDRIVGTRFQEVNRDSSIYGRLPLGSNVHLNEVGKLEAMFDSGIHGPNHVQDAIDGDTTSPFHLVSHELSVDENVNPEISAANRGQPSRPSQMQSILSEGTFAMRDSPDQISSQRAPHLRLQPQQPFVRPLTGIHQDQLSAVYEDIRNWRQRLKHLNNEISDAQQTGYNEIANGIGVKGWLMVGRGLRYIPGASIIEGRSKADIRWPVLQDRPGAAKTIAFWLSVGFVAISLSASLIAIAGLALSNAPNVNSYVPFLQPLANHDTIGAAIATTLIPAIVGSIFIIIALSIVTYAAKFNSSISVSHMQLSAFRATFFLLTFVSLIWLIAVGSVIFALHAFDVGSDRSQTVSKGSIYLATLILVFIINAAVIAPALLLLQPVRLCKILWNEKRAVTPRQRFRAIYPKAYNPTITIGCSTLAIVFASTFSLLFPLIGPAVVLLLLLMLTAHRFLVGYVYGRVGVGQTGGLLQIWLLKRFGSLLALQPILLGLILLSYRLWVLGGILLFTGGLILVAGESYATWKTREPSGNHLHSTTRQSLMMFRHIGLERRKSRGVPSSNSASGKEEQEALVQSEPQMRTRASMASVLEMMSITLAVIPSSSEAGRAVPLASEDIDDLTATERAARTRPDAPPHLPALSFTDHSQEMSYILYAPELLAPPPIIWLPNDRSGIALSEAYDLQRYHDLQTVLDIQVQDDVWNQQGPRLSRTHTRTSHQ